MLSPNMIMESGFSELLHTNSQLSLPLNSQESLEIEQTQLQSLQSPSASIETKVSIVTKSIQKRKRKELKRAVFIFHPEYNLKSQRRYLIRGDVVIDIDLILKNNLFGDCQLFREFRRPIAVEYQNNSRMFEVEIQRQNTAIIDFEFLIYILNSMGDQQCHNVATYLKEYHQFFKQFDEARKQKNNQDIYFGDTPYESYRRSLMNGNPSSESWSFENSYQKAQIIIKDLIENRGDFLRAYSISRGGSNQSSLEKFGIAESSMKLLYGNISIAEISKILLNNGQLVVESDIFEQISKKKKLFEMHLKNLLSDDMDNSHSFVINPIIKCQTISNVNVQVQVQVERIPLSNYSTPSLNDFLMIFTLTDEQVQSIYENNLIQQVLNENDRQIQLSENNILHTDFTYSLMSEHFIEKFYGGVHKTVNQVAPRLQRVLEKEQNIREYHQHLEQSASKTCGYRMLNPQQNSSVQPN